MIDLFLGLILAHIVGDFVFLPERWQDDFEEKSIFSPRFWIHLLIVAISLFAFVLLPQMLNSGIIELCTLYASILYFLSHAILDAFKAPFIRPGNRRILFFAKQSAVFLIILITAMACYRESIVLIDIFNSQILLLLVALLTQSFVLSTIIRYAMSKWEMPGTANGQESLPEAGKYIGMLERLLIFGFVIAGHWEAVGFLLAAKSIFRFGDLSRAKDRKLTEYVLIGTLLSFFLALVVSVAYRYLSLSLY